MNRWPIYFLLLLPHTSFAGGMNDDPALFYTNLHRFEVQEDHKQVIEAEFWYGRDLSKWAFDIDAERHSGEFEDLSFSISKRRALSAFWDAEVGIRRDLDPGSPSTRARFALTGIAPYFIETTLALHIDDNQAHLEIEFEHELPLSANWAIKSGLEIDAYSDSDEDRHESSGISEVEVSLLVMNERHKNLHPYFGIEYKHVNSSESASEASALLGLCYWF